MASVYLNKTHVSYLYIYLGSYNCIFSPCTVPIMPVYQIATVIIRDRISLFCDGCAFNKRIIKDLCVLWKASQFAEYTLPDCPLDCPFFDRGDWRRRETFLPPDDRHDSRDGKDENFATQTPLSATLTFFLQVGSVSLHSLWRGASNVLHGPSGCQVFLD